MNLINRLIFIGFLLTILGFSNNIFAASASYVYLSLFAEMPTAGYEILNNPITKAKYKAFCKIFFRVVESEETYNCLLDSLLQIFEEIEEGNKLESPAALKNALHDIVTAATVEALHAGITLLTSDEATSSGRDTHSITDAPSAAEEWNKLFEAETIMPAIDEAIETTTDLLNALSRTNDIALSTNPIALRTALHSIIGSSPNVILLSTLAPVVKCMVAIRLESVLGTAWYW